jgi:hypothetical protein
MSIQTVPAHYDGKNILIDKDVDIPEHAKLFVTIVSEPNGHDAEWGKTSLEGLAGAYGENEPDYSAVPLKESNPGYQA